MCAVKSPSPLWGGVRGGGRANLRHWYHHQMNTGRRTFDATPRRNKQLANSLRRNLTPHEKIMWRALRERLPTGLAHMRRQVTVGPYIVDFCDLRSRLVIEIDGHQHGQDEALQRDRIRDDFLREQSFRVLRFSNADVQQRLDEVIETIYVALTDQSGRRVDPHP